MFLDYLSLSDNLPSRPNWYYICLHWCRAALNYYLIPFDSFIFIILPKQCVTNLPSMSVLLFTRGCVNIKNKQMKLFHDKTINFIYVKVVKYCKMQKI